MSAPSIGNGMYDWLLWKVYVPTIHKAMCASLWDSPHPTQSDIDFCVYPERSFSAGVTVLIIVIGISLAIFIQHKLINSKAKILEKPQETEIKPLVFKNNNNTSQNNTNTSLASDIYREEKREQKKFELDWFERRRQIALAEVRSERIFERLEKMERIFMREWADFVSEHNPFGKIDAKVINQKFGEYFARKYTVDSPLLYLSNEPEVRQIVSDASIHIKRPNTSVTEAWKLTYQE